MDRLKGKVAVITGGAGGIGSADCTLFAREGAKVVITTGSKVDAGEALAEQICAEGGDAVFMKLDVTDEENWKAVMDFVIEKYGKLNILVNNAGASHEMDICETTLDEWNWHLKVNATGAFLGMKYAIEKMKDNGERCSIVNRSSIGGIIGVAGFCAYDAAKAAVVNMSKSAAIACGARGYSIRVNSVSPGCIKTALTAKDAQRAGMTPEAYWEMMAKHHPMGYIGEPMDIAYGDLYLASDESKFVTGQNLIIDGGWTVQ